MFRMVIYGSDEVVPFAPAGICVPFEGRKPCDCALRVVRRADEQCGSALLAFDYLEVDTSRDRTVSKNDVVTEMISIPRNYRPYRLPS